MKTYLAEITAAVDAAGTTEVLRFATAGYNTRSTDDPPNTHFMPRLMQPGLMERSLADRPGASGASSVGAGIIELLNIDGALDHLGGYGFGDRPVRVYLGDTGKAFSTFALVLSADAEALSYDRQSILIRLRDPLKRLDKPLAENTYGGTNVLPDGVDGVEDDIKGQRKPMVIGRVYNVAPVQVNTSKLVYQIHDGELDAVLAVYDRGAPLSAGADYSDAVSLLAAGVAAGYYTTCLAEGLIRLGSTPTGTITCDATQADLSTAQALEAVAESMDLEAVPADVAAMHAANPNPIGVSVGSETALGIMERIALGAGMWFDIGTDGLLRMGRLEPPAGLPVTTIESFQIKSLACVNARGSSGSTPTWRVDLGYLRMWTVQRESDLAGSVTPETRTVLGTEWRRAVQSDDAVKLQHLNAVELEQETCFYTAAAANAEASRLLDILKVQRDVFEVTCVPTAAQWDLLTLGAEVTLVHPRFGLAAGRNLRIVSLMKDLRADSLRVTLWG